MIAVRGDSVNPRFRGVTCVWGDCLAHRVLGYCFIRALMRCVSIPNRRPPFHVQSSPSLLASVSHRDTRGSWLDGPNTAHPKTNRHGIWTPTDTGVRGCLGNCQGHCELFERGYCQHPVVPSGTDCHSLGDTLTTRRRRERRCRCRRYRERCQCWYRRYPYWYRCCGCQRQYQTLPRRVPPRGAGRACRYR